jgi:hypothetical protein
MLSKVEGQSTAILPELAAATGVSGRFGLGRFPASQIELKTKTTRRNTKRDRFIGKLLYGRGCDFRHRFSEGGESLSLVRFAVNVFVA